MTQLPNWFYIAGSLCFMAGTVLNMLPANKLPRGDTRGYYEDHIKVTPLPR
jgi:hypothetical protein